MNNTSKGKKKKTSLQMRKDTALDEMGELIRRIQKQANEILEYRSNTRWDVHMTSTHVLDTNMGGPTTTLSATTVNVVIIPALIVEMDDYYESLKDILKKGV